LTLAPSQKELAAIIVLPKITQNKIVKNLPLNILKIVDELVKKTTNELASKGDNAK